MEYELKVLEQIISVVLNPTRIKLENLHNEFMSEVKLLAENEKERIRNQFRVVVFGEYKPGDLELYYQQHQAILVELADVVYNYLQPGLPESIYGLTKEGPILNFYKEIAKIPQDLLNFIEKNFSVYFNRDNKIPDAKRWMMAPGIKSNIKQIKKGLKKSNVDVELIKIACQPMEVCLLPETLISYNHLDYTQELQKELIGLTKKRGIFNANEELCRLLIQLNFNSSRFFSYYTGQLQAMAKAITNLQGLIEHHSLQLKIINQLPVKPGLIYKSMQHAIREQVGTWLSEELYFLKNQEMYENPGSGQKQELKANKNKICISLSVSQLALAVKLMVDSKLITNTGTAELMKLVARNFRTEKQELISEISLRNKSYNFESSTLDRLKDEIIGLMNLVTKY